MTRISITRLKLTVGQTQGFMMKDGAMTRISITRLKQDKNRAYKPNYVSRRNDKNLEHEMPQVASDSPDEEGAERHLPDNFHTWGNVGRNSHQDRPGAIVSTGWHIVSPAR